MTSGQRKDEVRASAEQGDLDQRIDVPCQDSRHEPEQHDPLADVAAAREKALAGDQDVTRRGFEVEKPDQGPQGDQPEQTVATGGAGDRVRDEVPGTYCAEQEGEAGAKGDRAPKRGPSGWRRRYRDLGCQTVPSSGAIYRTTYTALRTAVSGRTESPGSCPRW